MPEINSITIKSILTIRKSVVWVCMLAASVTKKHFALTLKVKDQAAYIFFIIIIIYSTAGFGR